MKFRYIFDGKLYDIASIDFRNNAVYLYYGGIANINKPVDLKVKYDARKLVISDEG